MVGEIGPYLLQNCNLLKSYDHLSTINCEFTLRGCKIKSFNNVAFITLMRSSEMFFKVYVLNEMFQVRSEINFRNIVNASIEVTFIKLQRKRSYEMLLERYKTISFVTFRIVKFNAKKQRFWYVLRTDTNKTLI